MAGSVSLPSRINRKDPSTSGELNVGFSRGSTSKVSFIQFRDHAVPIEELLAYEPVTSDAIEDIFILCITTPLFFFVTVSRKRTLIGKIFLAWFLAFGTVPPLLLQTSLLFL
jgi:hypothetical protein